MSASQIISGEYDSWRNVIFTKRLIQFIVKKKMKSIMFNFLYVVSEFLKTTDSAQGFTVSAITVELDIPISKQSWITIFSL